MGDGAVLRLFFAKARRSGRLLFPLLSVCWLVCKMGDGGSHSGRMRGRVGTCRRAAWGIRHDPAGMRKRLAQALEMQFFAVGRRMPEVSEASFRSCFAIVVFWACISPGGNVVAENACPWTCLVVAVACLRTSTNGKKPASDAGNTCNWSKNRAQPSEKPHASSSAPAHFA